MDWENLEKNYTSEKSNTDMYLRKLVERVAQGDTIAFEEVYSNQVNKIHGYIRSLVSDEFLVNDIIQETFLAVWKSAEKFRGDSSVSSWIINIARNKAMDTLRIKYKRKEDTLQFCDEIYGYEDEDFAEQLVDVIEMKKAIATLQLESRELLYMVFNLCLSYKEVADILKIPEGTVKSRCFYLRALLKKKILSL